MEPSIGRAQAFNDLYELTPSGDVGYSWREVPKKDPLSPPPRARHVAVTVKLKLPFMYLVFCALVGRESYFDLWWCRQAQTLQ